MIDKFIRGVLARRLNNLALAIEGRGSGGNVAPGFHLAASNRVRTGSIVPILYGEAEETLIALNSLNEPQRRVLFLHYVTRPPMHVRYRESSLRRDAYYRLVDVASKKIWNAFNQLKEKSRPITGSAIDDVGKTSTMPPMLVKSRRGDED